MANSKSPKVTGLALTLSILSVAAYVPSPMFLQGALGFDFGIGAVKNKVMHPFGGGNDKGAADSGDAGKGAGDDADTGKEPGAAKGQGADKDQSEETAAPPKKERTGEIEIPSAAEDMTKVKIQDADPTVGKDLARTKRKAAPEDESPEKFEATVSHPKLEPKKYYDDEGAEMEESEYYDEQEKKRKAKQLQELIAPAGSPEDNDPEPHLIKAKRLTQKSQFKEALTEINIALKLKPQYWEAHYQGALIMQTMGRNKEAIKEYKYLVDVKPEYTEAHINLGVLLAKEGEDAAAAKEYKKALELNFYSLSAHYNLANLYIKQEKLNEALSELKICLKLKPTNAWVHNNLGVIYQKRNYLEEAEEEFLKALKLEPANKSFEANLYLVRTQQKKKPVRATVTAPAETG